MSNNLKNINLNQALDVAVEVAQKAGEIIKNFLGKKYKVNKKEGLDIVSEVDYIVEKVIIDSLKKSFPNHTFTSEELSKSGEYDKDLYQYNWIIDPIDGTINYVSKLPLFSTSIALQKENNTLLGVIYNPITGNTYTSVLKHGSFLNDKRIYVSEEKKLENSVISFMLTSHYNKYQIQKILKIVEKLAIKTRGLRLYVSGALELAFVASGKLEGAICIKSRGFSSAAGTLIVREAGGKATDISGDYFNNDSRSLLVSNSILHDCLLGILKKDVF